MSYYEWGVLCFNGSEFGADPDKMGVSDLNHGFYSRKSEIRRLVKAEAIPYTYICCNFYMSYLRLRPSLIQPGLKSHQGIKLVYLEMEMLKGVFMKERDVAAFTISTVDDPRTLNKVLYLRPPGNTISMNELIDIWEDKIGTKLERSCVTKEELLKKIHQTPYRDNMEMVVIYSLFDKRDQTYFDINSSGDVEGSQCYIQISNTEP